MLKPVDCLEFIILVDNNVEWMSKLPVGFSSEIRLHLENEPPVDPVTKVPIVDLDHYCCGAHGLAILIVCAYHLHLS
jgi:7,8-dihydropterin-6-yl-methyl-4-(beta-D-ribofuranosyl)aminobenzene 5'-phosphate synthase